MLAFLAFAAIGDVPPTVEVRSRARASVRVYQGTKVTAEEWKRDTNKAVKRETVIRGEDGRPLPIRLIEYQ
jgi:hypothetical protein